MEKKLPLFCQNVKIICLLFHSVKSLVETEEVVIVVFSWMNCSSKTCPFLLNEWRNNPVWPVRSRAAAAEEEECVVACV